MELREELMKVYCNSCINETCSYKNKFDNKFCLIREKASESIINLLADQGYGKMGTCEFYTKGHCNQKSRSVCKYIECPDCENVFQPIERLK